MEESEIKCVLVLDGDQAPGVQANAAVILGMTLGERHPALVGPDARDGDGGLHPGISTSPVPVLKIDADGLQALRKRLREPRFAGVFCADFSDVAQCCRSYPAYLEKAARTREEEHRYLGLCLCGKKKLVNRLTGYLPLLR